jgi:Anti-sigma-K factor rskA
VDIQDIISSGLLELYATGLASEQEVTQVLQWVQQYPEVADELEQIEAGLAMYAQANSIQPGPSVKEKIFAKINEQAKVVPIKAVEQNNVKVVSISSSWKNAAAAAVVLLIGSAALNIIQFNKNDKIAKELDQNKELVSNLQDKSKELEDNWHIVQSKYSQPVTVNGLDVSPDAQAKVFWMKNTGDVYVDPSNLPEAPEGKQYELWAIVNGAPVNAGIIITTKKGVSYNIQKMKGFGKVDAFAVSIENLSTKPAEKPGVVMAVGKI